VRIAYFCQYFVPESAAPAARVSELAHSWTDAGHQVTVITGLPNHPTGVVPDDYRRVVFRRERLLNVDVWRNWLYATPNEGFVKKTLSHLSFMLSTLILSVPRLRGHDVMIVSSPSFFVVITVCLAHWFWRIPYIFEVRDLWPGVFVELGVLRNRLLIRALERLEMFLYRRADRVVVVTEAFRDILVARGLSPASVSVVTNGVNVSLFQPSDDGRTSIRREHDLHASFIVLYIGAHGISQGLGSILEVAERLAGHSTVRFVFVGAGAQKASLVAQAEKLGLTNVRFLPSQPRERVPDWYGAADVVLVPLRNIPMFETFIPSKMFEILACARPVVASVRGESRRIFERSRGALVADPEDVGAIAAAILRLEQEPALRTELGQNGRRFVLAEYDRRVLAERYLGILTEVRGGGQLTEASRQFRS
jgi:glycosyltransferase involved in cell wall biosynthesis